MTYFQTVASSTQSYSALSERNYFAFFRAFRQFASVFSHNLSLACTEIWELGRDSQILELGLS